MNAELIKEMVNEIHENAEEWRPVVGKMIGILNSYGPELRSVVRSILMATVELKIEMVRKYEAAGFTTEQAIMMTMDEWFSVARNARVANKR